MKNILITGVTGNVGAQVINYLFENNTTNNIIGGVRNIEKARKQFAKYPQLEFKKFDFMNTGTFEEALAEIDTVFLLRPPQISDVSLYFFPLIEALKNHKIAEIIFLSVQGVEKSKIIPHNKIEKLIRDSGMEYIFLRPDYFMQNLTTTLYKDIKRKNKIILPAGKAKFNWVDINNIAESAAILLENFNNYSNNAFDITGYENLNFRAVVNIINQTLATDIQYENVNPVKFYRIKKNSGMNKGMILVMIMLHFLPRFQKPPAISSFYENLTGKKPTTIKDFVKREKAHFLETHI